MARRMIWEPAVQEVVRDRLVPLYLRAGSVHALADLLNAAGVGDTVHPNRVHGLLSEDARRGVNDATLEAVRAAADAALAAPDPDPDRTRHLAARLRAEVLPRAAEAADPAGLAVVAGAVGLPAAVVRHFLAEAGTPPAGPVAPASPVVAPPAAPDWGHHDAAVPRVREALRRGPGRKVGVVVPTGGGKTRIGHRVALAELADGPDPTARVAWLTHRVELRRQAQADLGRLTAGDPAAAALARRVDFLMVGELAGYLAARTPLLVVVDEAHHAPAPSYRPLFDAPTPVPAVFLTATPNRTDGLPLGVDEIAYSVTYRELADRGVVLRPTFEPFPVRGFDWGPAAVRDLAAFVLDRAEADFVKTLVIAPTVERVTDFYDALADELAGRPSHPVPPDALGYVVAGRTSHGLDPSDLLDLFRGKDRAVLVSAQMLLEGFDDPGINAVVVTYPSSSLTRLMQAAGRCVRSAPGKTAAFVVQARDPDLGYYYDEGWLYQDLSDVLRPRLLTADYVTADDLAAQVQAVLAAHHVGAATRAAVERRLAAVRPGDEFRLLLSGLPYHGPPDRFAADARWSAVAAGPADLPRLLAVFNGYCDGPVGDPDPRAFLLRHLPRTDAADGDWRLLYAMLLGMNHARAELAGQPHPAGGRGFRGRGPTTWLAYHTFRHRPRVPAELVAFLEPCANRPQALTAYAADPGRWALAVRLRLPLGGWWAELLDRPQAEWLAAARAALAGRLAGVEPGEQFAAVAGWRAGLPVVPVPAPLADRLDALVPADEAARHTLPLSPG